MGSTEGFTFSGPEEEEEEEKKVFRSTESNDRFPPIESIKIHDRKRGSFEPAVCLWFHPLRSYRGKFCLHTCTINLIDSVSRLDFLKIHDR